MASYGKRTVKTLIDSEVWGNILLHDATFSEDDHVITKAFLNRALDRLHNELDEEFVNKLILAFKKDDALANMLKNAFIVLISKNPDVRAALKSFILSLILSDDDIQNAIKLLMAWIIRN